jgi:small-conductance mechanosensitive channel
MDFIQSASGGMVMAVGWLFAYLGVLLWARQPHHRDRWLVVTAATAMGVIVFMVNQIARAVGWWDWWGYALPLIVQAGLLLLGPSVFFIFILTGYRWLVAHSQRPLLNYGLIMIIVLVPLTVIGDLYSIERRKLSFGGGYTIWQDVLVGQAFVWLPIFLYRAIHRWYQASLSKHRAG